MTNTYELVCKIISMLSEWDIGNYIYPDYFSNENICNPKDFNLAMDKITYIGFVTKITKYHCPECGSDEISDFDENEDDYIYCNGCDNEFEVSNATKKYFYKRAI